MAVFMTKVWGFEVPAGPLQIGQEGWRDRARDLLRPGDLVVLVGTQGNQTPPDQRGKIIGLME